MDVVVIIEGIVFRCVRREVVGREEGVYLGKRSSEKEYWY